MTKGHWSPFRNFVFLGNLLWVPLCFINFDAHHDGIILSTVNQLRVSLSTGGDWPFNQYGSSWIFPYLAVSYIVPQDLLYLSIRFVTIFYYIAASYFLYRSALHLANPRVAKVSYYLCLALQPFLGSWNTSLLPWPSSFAFLLVASLLFLLLEFAQQEARYKNRLILLAGIVCAVILGSRIQVGILLIIGITAVLTYNRVGRLRIFYAGILIWLALLATFLQIQGWFWASLYDSLILGGQFLGSDHLHYPLPILSALAGIVLTFAIWLVSQKNINKLFIGVFFSLIAVAGIYFTYRALGVGWNVANAISVLQRKILSAVFFSSVFFLVLDVFGFVKNRREVKLTTSNEIVKAQLLIVVSVASASQAWPFFDQMHVWWSASPLIIIFARRVSALSFTRRWRFTNIISIGSALVMSIMVFTQFLSDRVELRSLNQKYIYVSSADEQVEASLSTFLKKSIPVGSTILNLCPNAYPFFREGEYISASRFFVYWSNFESAPIDFKDYNSTEIENVLVCTTNLYQGSAQLQYVLRQQDILNSLSGIEQVDNLTIGGFNWKIFIKSKEL